VPYRIGALSWEHVLKAAENNASKGPLIERRILRELACYFREVADMRDIDSNQAYCVVLSGETIEGSSLTWIEVVTKHRKYYYSATGGSGWPKAPPNYMAFRYYGRLQSIHHVDSYEVVSDLSKVLPLPQQEEDPLFVLSLGPPITPSREVPNGPSVQRNMRVWVDIDLLLTSPTISDALKATHERRMEL